MYSLICAELNTFTPDLEESTKNTDITNTADTVIIKNVANTTAEDTAQDGAYKQVPARTDIIFMSFKKPQQFVMNTVKRTKVEIVTMYRA